MSGVRASKRIGPHDVRRGERGEALRLAFREFLGGAGLVTVAVLALAGLAHFLDRVQPGVLAPVHDALSHHVFRGGQSTATLLQSISATVITVASITFSLMLVAVQQSASSLTAQVFDQFLRRRSNQFYFGFFVAVGASALMEAATAHQRFNPVYGAALTVLLSVLGVLLLLVLVYTAINQMRPVVIVEAIHDHLVESRGRQLERIVRRTRAAPELDAPEHAAVTSDLTGFVLRIDLDRLQRAIVAAGVPCEIVLDVSIGAFVAYGDPLARVRTVDDAAADSLAEAVRASIGLERQRNIDDVDAAFGVEQLETVGWTSTSGAKHNPQAARLVVASLRDVLARLAVEASAFERQPDTDIVYDDDFPATLMQTLESLAVVTADSQQHQAAAHIIAALDSVLERLADPYRERAVDLLMRTLPALASHPPTLPLERALTDLRATLRRMDLEDAATVVDEGLQHLHDRIGTVEIEYTPR